MGEIWRLGKDEKGCELYKNENYTGKARKTELVFFIVLTMKNGSFIGFARGFFIFYQTALI